MVGVSKITVTYNGKTTELNPDQTKYSWVGMGVYNTDTYKKLYGLNRRTNSLDSTRTSATVALKCKNKLVTQDIYK